MFFVADPERDVQVIDPVRRRLDTTDQLARLTNRAPLDLLADAFTRAPGLSEQARVAFDAYEEFRVMLGDPERRSHLDALSMDHADDDAVFQQVRDMGRRFQSSLTALFTKDDSPFRSLTMEYGIF